MEEDPCDYDFELLRFENCKWVRVATYSGGCSLGSVLEDIKSFNVGRDTSYRINTPLFKSESSSRILIYNSKN